MVAAAHAQIERSEHSGVVEADVQIERSEHSVEVEAVVEELPSFECDDWGQLMQEEVVDCGRPLEAEEVEVAQPQRHPYFRTHK